MQNKKKHLKFFGIGKILPFLKHVKGQILMMVILAFISSLVDVTIPQFQRYALDEFVGRGIERHLRVRFQEAGYVDSGKQLILLGEDQLALDGRNQPHPTELVEYIKSKAKSYEWTFKDADVTLPDEKIFDIMNETTAEKQRIELVDVKTGKKVRSVEYQGVDLKTSTASRERL